MCKAFLCHGTAWAVAKADGKDFRDSVMAIILPPCWSLSAHL